MDALHLYLLYSKCTLCHHFLGFFPNKSSGIYSSPLTIFNILSQVVPGRMSLLVTLFLSLTTLLVSTVSSSPPVAVGISALTAWIIIQYVFLIIAIIAYAYLLAFFRFSDGVDEKKKMVAKDIDRSFITIFPIIYFSITIIYWLVCL